MKRLSGSIAEKFFLHYIVIRA